MKYIAAYALLVLGGKADPSEADLDKLLKEAGIKADADHAKRVVNSLKGKKFYELVAEGKKKMSAASPVAVAHAGGAPSGPKKDEKPVKEEKPKEEEAAADVDMGGLFGEEY